MNAERHQNNSSSNQGERIVGYHNDKRSGRDRRQVEQGPPKGKSERRKDIDRRQTEISEISYFEWASFFVKYQGKALDDIALQNAELLGKVKD